MALSIDEWCLVNNLKSMQNGRVFLWGFFNNLGEWPGLRNIRARFANMRKLSHSETWISRKRIIRKPSVNTADKCSRRFSHHRRKANSPETRNKRSTKRNCEIHIWIRGLSNAGKQIKIAMDLFLSMFARVRKAKKNVCRERRHSERKGGALCETINNESSQKIAVINFPPSPPGGRKRGKARTVW